MGIRDHVKCSFENKASRACTLYKRLQSQGHVKMAYRCSSKFNAHYCLLSCRVGEGGGGDAGKKLGCTFLMSVGVAEAAS